MEDNMVKMILKIEGMACGMCEAHVNDAVKKVSSSCRKGITEIVAEQPLDALALKQAIERTGYKVLDISVENYEKKRLFSFK